MTAPMKNMSLKPVWRALVISSDLLAARGAAWSSAATLTLGTASASCGAAGLVGALVVDEQKSPNSPFTTTSQSWDCKSALSSAKGSAVLDERDLDCTQIFGARAQAMGTTGVVGGHQAFSRATGSGRIDYQVIALRADILAIVEGGFLTAAEFGLAALCEVSP